MPRRLTNSASLTWDFSTPSQVSGDVVPVTEYENVLLTGYLDLTEIAAPASPASNVGRAYAVDDGAGVTTLAMKDSAGNVVPLSHFLQSGTGAVTRTQQSKLADTISVIDFGADPTGTNDSAAAIQAAIDAAALIITARSTVHIPSAGAGNSYKINSALTWKPNVNFLCDPGVRIFAGAAMEALLQTDVGSSGVRLRQVWLSGGRWDGVQLARRGIWIKEGEKVHLHDFSIRAIGAFTDGTSETESSYIRIGDPAQTTGNYEIMVDNFSLYRDDSGGASTEAPALNYGVYSAAGEASDCHITNGVVSGVKFGVAGGLAHWKIAFVHVWNFEPNHGALVNGFYATDFGGVHFIGCQVDTKTFEVPFRIDGTNHPSVMIGCQILCDDGTDNTGAAIEIGTGGQVTAVGNVITCDASHRFAADFTGDLTGLTVVGHQNRNVVTPVGSSGLVTPGFFVGGHSARVAMNESIAPRLQTHGANSGDSSYAGVRWSNDASSPQLSMGKSRGAIGTHTVVQSGDSLGKFRFEGSDGDEFLRGAQIEAFVDGTPGNGDMPGRLVFSTTADGASSPTEALRIDATQQLRFAAASFTANGASAVTISNVRPAAAATATITKWLTFKDQDGVDSYIPVWQ